MENISDHTVMDFNINSSFVAHSLIHSISRIPSSSLSKDRPISFTWLLSVAYPSQCFHDQRSSDKYSSIYFTSPVACFGTGISVEPSPGDLSPYICKVKHLGNVR